VSTTEVSHRTALSLLPKNALEVRKALDQRGVGLALANTPAQERADPRQPVADGVVGPELTAPGAHRGLCQLAWKFYTDVVEQVRQLRLVLPPGVGVWISEDELADLSAMGSIVKPWEGPRVRLFVS
jgi:hypothetical protein